MTTTRVFDRRPDADSSRPNLVIGSAQVKGNQSPKKPTALVPDSERIPAYLEARALGKALGQAADCDPTPGPDD